ncbi:MAG: GntR family transcriptional regulator [Fibrobacteria bacterium]|nr:GntR family transcriptional regulator [Fibrobacteria bacterium]
MSAEPHESVDLRPALLDLVAEVVDQGGRELPSLRDLSARFGVAPNTVKKALLELEGPFQIEPVHGKGFFVRLPGEAISTTAESPASETAETIPDGSLDDAPESGSDSQVSPDPDLSYSPVPEEGRAMRPEPDERPDTVLVVGQVLSATDPTGAPGARFQLFLQMRHNLQGMGMTLAWAPVGYTESGAINPNDRRSLAMQLAGLGDRLAGVLLIDPGYGKDEPLWSLVAEATEKPVVWFHSVPLPPSLQPVLPPHCHILEPDWEEVGKSMGRWLLENHQPQKILLLPPPGRGDLPAHLVALRETLVDGWGPRWTANLSWFDVFPAGLPKHSTRTLLGKIRRTLHTAGLAEFELDRFFRVAAGLKASLWVCADDLLALAAIDHFEARQLPNEPRPGIVGFGNHPFALARGLCTVDFSWPSFIERGLELFTGYGRRARQPRYSVVPAPSHSVYGGNILGRNEDWW